MSEKPDVSSFSPRERNLVSVHSPLGEKPGVSSFSPRGETWCQFRRNLVSVIFPRRETWGETWCQLFSPRRNLGETWRGEGRNLVSVHFPLGETWGRNLMSVHFALVGRPWGRGFNSMFNRSAICPIHSGRNLVSVHFPLGETWEKPGVSSFSPRRETWCQFREKPGVSSFSPGRPALGTGV